MIFKRIFIEKAAENAPMTRRILDALPNLPVEWVDQESSLPQIDSLTESKKTLYLTRFKGELVKPCPGTRDYICCGYRILHIGSNCPVDCSYCILQAYFNQPFIRIFVNTEEIFLKLKKFIETHPEEIIRLGTGEYTDSLALDQLTGFSDLLLQELSSYPHVLVELKTKTSGIHNLIKSPPIKNIIVSWSLNALEIIRKEDRGSASLQERLEAAVVCQEKGYNLGFHFDPIFFFNGWEEAYEQTVRLLFSKIRPEKIVWISMGCFRYMPALKSIIQQRNPKAGYIYQEFIPALDKKMRYPQSKRVEIYKKLLSWIKNYGKEVPVYLCMENQSVWEKVFGFIPGIEVPTLKEMLDQRVKEIWGIDLRGPKVL
jgi:spore photoproduct lyase